MEPPGEASGQRFGAGQRDQRRPVLHPPGGGRIGEQPGEPARVLHALSPQSVDQLYGLGGIGIVDRPGGQGADEMREGVEPPLAERDVIGRRLGQPHEGFRGADLANGRLEVAPEAGEEDQGRGGRLLHPGDRLRIGAKMPDPALGRSGQNRPEPARIDPIEQAERFVLEAHRARKGVEPSVLKAEEGEFVPHEAPAVFAQQGAKGRFAGARMAGQKQRPSVPLDACGVEQKECLLPERHLQIHPHLGGEQPLRQRQRRRVGEHIIAADRDRRAKPAPPHSLGLQADGEIAQARRLGIARIKAAKLIDRPAPLRADPERHRPHLKAEDVVHGRSHSEKGAIASPLPARREGLGVGASERGRDFEDNRLGHAFRIFGDFGIPEADDAPAE